MFCKYCGKKIDGDSVFCMFCGKKVNDHKVKENDYGKTHKPVKQNGT